MQINRYLEVLDLANNFLQLSFLAQLKEVCSKNVKVRRITDIPSVRRKLESFRNVRSELKDLSSKLFESDKEALLASYQKDQLTA